MTLSLLNLKCREVRCLLAEIEWSAANGNHAAVHRDALRMEEIAGEVMQSATADLRRLNVKVSL